MNDKRKEKRVTMRSLNLAILNSYKYCPYCKKRLTQQAPRAKKCAHEKTVALNEEGNAGIYRVNCGEQLTREC